MRFVDKHIILIYYNIKLFTLSEKLPDPTIKVNSFDDFNKSTPGADLGEGISVILLTNGGGGNMCRSTYIRLISVNISQLLILQSLH